MTEKWSKYDIAWLAFSIFLILIAVLYKSLYVVGGNSFLSWVSNISALMGIIYVFGIAKQTKFAYFFGIANVILYALVCKDKGLYISSTYNLLYSCPMMIYGYFYWSKIQNEEHSGIKCICNKNRVILGILMIFAVLGLAMTSKILFDGKNVILDSTVSVCVCVATFLMARKYVEQWILFIIANFVGVIMFAVVNFNDMSNIELLLMWIIYLINSVYGAVVWKRALKK